MSWYKKSMPQIKDVKSFVAQVCADIKTVPGVTGIFLYGSYVDNINKPNHVIKDIDIIAATEFDSGDLLAIDNSRYSALKIHPNELEDEGFNPKAVAFTKKFLSFSEFNIDHWATAFDGKLLHWGAIPDNKEEWEELHKKAEQEAQRQTGLTRKQLIKAEDIKRREWKRAFDEYTKNYLKNAISGWCMSELDLNSIKKNTVKV